jgi:ABC-2 type transport system permease protein
MHAIIIARRVILQLRGDKRFLILSIIAPLIIIYFLKLLYDALIPTMGPMGSIALPRLRFVMPAAAFIVHFLSFVLCAMLLVQERTKGTLERMLISGFRRTSIIAGYTLGYFALATLQAIAVLAESIWLFDLDIPAETIAILFLVIWLLAIVSVMLGIFVSTFARHEGHVLPFIPLVILPSVFLTGVVVDPAGLPKWAEVLGYIFPIRYANEIIKVIVRADYEVADTFQNFAILIGYAIALWLVASFTLRERE